MQVGFIGLGRMGSPIAANLLGAGHDLTVYNRTKAKAEYLVPRGAQLAKTPGDAARGDVVITMLADDHAVDQAVFAKDGILAALAPGAIHVSMSTISVALSERLDAAHREKRQGFVSAPVFGRPDASDWPAHVSRRRGAANGELGQAQRQFPDRFGNRGFRGSLRAHRQGGY